MCVDLFSTYHVCNILPFNNFSLFDDGAPFTNGASFQVICTPFNNHALIDSFVAFENGAAFNGGASFNNSDSVFVKDDMFDDF